jgi:hypothetical protein
LFAQEYLWDDLVILWDEIFARIDEIIDYVMYVGIGHLKQMDDWMDISSLSHTMSVLLNAAECDLRATMRLAGELWRADDVKDARGSRPWVTALLSYALSLWSNLV